MTETPVTTLLVLGASGDLTSRLLLPGLGSLLAVEPERRVRVVGADRAELSEQDWHDKIRTAMHGEDVPQDRIDELLTTADYVKVDLLESQELTDLIAEQHAPLVLYFALPPQVSVKLCALLEDIDLPEGTRLALEKPFGHDLDTARELNRQLLRVVPEEQIHRVDHFLGVNTVLNLIGIRFANRLLQPLWSGDHIDSVDITYDETLALEGRAGYYDKAGALVDMLQSHLLQVLALFAMEAPSALTSIEVQSLKAQVLRATHVWQDDPTTASHRARYTAGQVGDHEVPDYAAEDGVDPEQETETLAQVTLAVDNARWGGVPFRLRSGKALGDLSKRIVVTFKAPAHVPTGLYDVPDPDRLVLDLKPGAVRLELSMNAEGDPFHLEQKALTAELGKARMLPYGEVLAGIFDGDALLSIRGDVAQECWRIMTPVLQAWRDGAVALDSYPAGSAGPSGWQGSAT
ncbi:MAG: glucose-6-phosphate dehydrogenase [Ornithinimicrobium sp.]